MPLVVLIWGPSLTDDLKAEYAPVSQQGYTGIILGLYWCYIGVILGLYWGYIRVILGLYWDYNLGLCWGYTGIVEKNMEATIYGIGVGENSFAKTNIC